MLMSGQNPALSTGKILASSAPSAPPIINSGARTPPEVPEPSENAQNEARGSRALEQIGDRVVSHAKGSREHQAPEPHGHTSDGGPPHPVDG